jgi:hypothetical protein
MTYRQIPLTLEQREDMLHALGSSHGKLGWRNYFCAGQGKQQDEWDELVRFGVAQRTSITPSDGDVVYRVSEVGIQALGYDPSILEKPITLGKIRRSR